MTNVTKPLITFDFDGTLFHQGYFEEKAKPIFHILDIMKQFIADGYNVAILTTRRDIHVPEVKDFVVEYIDLPIQVIFR